MTAPEKREVRLDPALQARLLEQMRDEQEATMRRNRIKTWILTPTAVALVILGAALTFSDDLVVAALANLVAVGLFWVLWRIHRGKIRSALGLE